jgi:hydroxyacylglutathione hydrolase
MTFSDASPCITPIHAFEDNLIWCLNREAVPGVVVVDPGEAGPVIDWLRLHSKLLIGVLITHHHGDHTGGIKELTDYCLAEQGLRPVVYGPESCLAKGVGEIVGEGSEVVFESLGLRLQVLFVPGHTQDHLAYKLDTGNGWDEAIFCGDTLFAAGCGRLLGGTAEQMFHSLHRLAALPEATRVYCAHEYTLGNLLFARATFPDSQAISDRLTTVQSLRQENKLTLPSTLAEERRTNPFLACSNVQEFSRLRQAKDQFRPN